MAEKQKRIRIGRLDTAGGIAYEHAKILKMLRRGLNDAALASRLSQMFVNQRTLMEFADSEKRIAELEALLEAKNDIRNVVQLKRA